MKIAFPSPEFDDAVAAICHGTTSDEQAQALHGLLRSDAAARDEYIIRVELHSRLASEPDLFVSADADEQALARSAGFQPAVSQISNLRALENCSASELSDALPNRISRYSRLKICAAALRRARIRESPWILALAACVVLLAGGWWALRFSNSSERKGATSKAVAMLNRAVDAQWNLRDETPRLGAPLEPGSVRLNSGLAQIVFYSGARLAIEGPTELQIISSSEASCRNGRLMAEVPAEARGFRMRTPQMNVTDLGTALGLEVKARRTELHVFKGSVEFQPTGSTTKQNVKEGAGTVIESSRGPQLIAANPAAFASLFDLQAKSLVAEALRYDQWRAASHQLNQDPSLLVHFDFDQAEPAGWRLHNASSRSDIAPHGTIVGCRWIEGRWPDKQALEFRGVSDRVRLSVSGEYESLTLAAWVRVQGLDRQFNSLFMCDGFEAGTLHWLIRKDGVLGLTAIGAGSGDYQIVASPSVLTLDQYGMWVHLAVVLDGNAKRVVHYANGQALKEKTLKLNRPFRIGVAELGNWNASGFTDNHPWLIRNFSGAMDEFCLFSRALNADEIRALYSAGKPQSDPLAQNQH
ncbi:MAG: hypothetical protein HYY23_09355 [Verrucomicrobia bacterium]|nr:hypothetical protein [Verrucomicrobiota bacterium]